MATITLRVDDDVRDQMQSLADGQGITISELLRSAIDGLFDRDDRTEPRRSTVPESINSIDRKQLALLHRILARLVDDQNDDDREVSKQLGEDGDSKHQLRLAETLESGWTMDYDDEFVNTLPELSRRDCGLVMDILDMFCLLRRSINALPNTQQDELRPRLRFSGFHANDRFEVRLLAYAQAVVSGGRWRDLEDVFSPQNDNGNSHFPLLASYRRMLAAYEPIRNAIVHGRGRTDYTLTVDELEQVAQAAVHPNHGA